jgi:hypothetical protein
MAKNKNGAGRHRSRKGESGARNAVVEIASPSLATQSKAAEAERPSIVNQRYPCHESRHIQVFDLSRITTVVINRPTAIDVLHRTNGGRDCG